MKSKENHSRKAFTFRYNTKVGIEENRWLFWYSELKCDHKMQWEWFVPYHWAHALELYTVVIHRWNKSNCQNRFYLLWPQGLLNLLQFPLDQFWRCILKEKGEKINKFCNKRMMNTYNSKLIGTRGSCFCAQKAFFSDGNSMSFMHNIISHLKAWWCFSIYFCWIMSASNR